MSAVVFVVGLSSFLFRFRVLFSCTVLYPCCMPWCVVCHGPGVCELEAAAMRHETSDAGPLLPLFTLFASLRPCLPCESFVPSSLPAMDCQGDCTCVARAIESTHLV